MSLSLRVTSIAGPLLATLVFATAAFGWRDINILDFGFSPDAVNVEGGEDLHWTNRTGVAQSVTSDTGLFDSGAIPPGGGYSMKLQVPGRFGYRSTASPQHTGVLVVPVQKLAGPGGDPAADHIPELEFPPAEEGDVKVHERWGVPASTTRILLGLKEGATVEQANAALTSVDAAVVGGLPDVGILLLRVAPGSGEPFQNLTDALERLRLNPVVDFAAMSLVGGPQTVPRGPGDSAATQTPPWTWRTRTGDSNWGLKSARFPQAWNLLETIRRKSPRTITGIIDAGFDQEHPDLKPALTLPPLCLTPTDCRRLENTPDDHGNRVAGIVGAAYDNDLDPKQDGRSLGISGGNPVARMQGFPTDYGDPEGVLDGAAWLYDEQLELFDLVLRSRPADLRVINYSAGAALFEEDGALYKNSSGEMIWWKSFPNRTCGPGPTDDDLPEIDWTTKDYCTPNNEDGWLREFAQVGRAAARIAKLASQAGVMIVQSAGNDGTTFCPPAETNCTSRQIRSEHTNEFAWTAANWSRLLHYDVAGLANPILIAEATWSGGRASYSNVGGDVAAPGSSVLSTVLNNGYESAIGTSLAAPHVTALVGYLLADDPALSLGALRRKVIAFGSPPAPKRAVDFDWQLEDRTGRDDDGDGLVDYATSTAGVNPASYRVDFDACESGLGTVKPARYRWDVDGATVATTSECRFHWDFAAEGRYSVKLTITGEDGSSSEATKPVKVDDLLLVSIGDSIASGEGNPDFQKAGLFKAARWQSSRCHRSAKAGPAQAARWLEESDVHSSVTFLHLACSGARIQGDLDASGTPEAGFAGVGGLLTPYEGLDPPNTLCEKSRRLDADACLKPQLAESKEIVSPRTPDALLISIGANDMWFSEIVKDCIKPLNECGAGEALRIFNDRIALLPARYELLDRRIRLAFPDLPLDHVFITQYPDPTHNGSGQIDMSCLPGMRQQEAEWAADTVVPRLNNEVAKAAASYGWTLVDGISTDFSHHGYCAADRWFVQILESVGNQGNKYGAFHPNFRGHQQYAERIVGKIRQKLGARPVQPTLPIRDGVPRLDAFASMLSAEGAAKRLVDVNDGSKDGNRRVIRDRAADGTISETPEETFSKVPGELTAPDGYVDMRDFRRFRDAYLQACVTSSQPEVLCPDAGDVSLDGADTHPKKDLNFDGCVDVEPANPKNCDAKEPDFSRFDFNGDDELTAARKAFVPLKADEKAASDRAEGSQLSDLDLLAALWSLNPKASEGWGPTDLVDLIGSADLEAHADALFNEGASKADVKVRLASSSIPVGPVRTLKRGEDFAVMTIPLGGSTSDEYQVVTTATTDKGTSQSVSEKLKLKFGEDRRVDLCPGISLKADPPRVPADGTSTSKILLTLSSCDGKRDVAGKPITWTLSPTTGGTSLDLTPSTTDANGKAAARFTAGTAQTSYTIEAIVELENGNSEKASVVVDTVPKLTIKYVWQQAYEEYTESGSTRWTGNTSALTPDCTIPGVVEYCIDASRVELDAPNRYGAQRDGTLTGGGATFKLTETASRSLGVTRSSWTTSTPDGTTKNGEQLNQWFITDPDAYQDHNLDGLRADDLSDGVHISNLEAVGNLPYHYALTSVRTGGDADAVRPVELGAVSHAMLLVPQRRGKPIRFATGPDREIVFERRDDGRLKPFQSCGRLNDDLTTQPGYYVASPSDWIPGGTTIDRKTAYVAGDRPMPVGPGRVRIRYAFAAVAAYHGQTVPDPQLPDCTQNTPPNADFSFTPQAPDEGRQVSFTDKSTDMENDVSKWQWSFGDGSSDSTPSPYHMFADNGTYAVTLTVTDKDGATSSTTKHVVVKNLPPEAELEAGTAQVGQPLTVVSRLLDAGSIDKTQLRYSITSPNPVWPAMSGTREANVYTESLTGLPAGTYPLTLTVRDKDDEVAIATDIAIVTPEARPPPPPPPPPRFYGTCDASVRLDSEEQRFLDLVNDYRAENGLQPVAVSPALNKAADAHAHDMATHNFMDHKGSDGSQPADRARKAGYPKTAAVSENIARGTPSGRDALWAWRSSTTGHNENMLNPAWRAVGIARESGSGDWFWATSYGDLLDCLKLPSDSTGGAPQNATDQERATTKTVRSVGGVEPVRLSHNLAKTNAMTAAKDATNRASLISQTAAGAGSDPPIPAFTISDTTPLQAVPVAVTNASRDATGSPIGAVLDFGDGTPSVALAAGESVSHSYAQIGVHEAVLKATDAEGRSLAVHRRLSIGAVSLPVPLIYYRGATQGIAGEQVTLTAALRDFATPLPGKTLTFSLGGVSTSAVTSAEGVADVTMLLTHAPGDYDLVVRFDGDPEYHWQELHVPFTVVSNAPPVASPGGPYQLLEGGALTLDASASSDPDPGDRVVTYAWDLNDDGTFGEVVGGTPTPIAWGQVQTLVCGGSCERARAYPIALKVTDMRGASATAKTTMTVISDFTITLDPATQALSPGSSNSFAVSLASLGGFASPVTLSVSGLPPGFTASFDANPITPPGVTTLTITASQNAPEGVVALTVVGTGGGITREANGSVNVAFGLIPVCYGTFTGKVTDGETGEPLAGVTVGSYPTAVTDHQGLYTITQVPLGFNNASIFYYLPTNLTGYWQASKYGRAICGVVTRVDLQPIKVRYGTAAGRVMVGTPDPDDHNWSRKVTPTDTPVPDAKVTGYYPHGVSATDAVGRYTRQLGLGHNNTAYGHWLRAEAPGYWYQDKFVNAEANVTKQLDFELVEKCEGTFTGGRLIHGQTREPLRIENVVVELYGTTHRSTTTDHNGVFGFNSRELLAYNNSPATYFIRAGGGSAYFTINDCGVSVSQDIPMYPPAPDPIPNYGYLEGYVFDEETGEPVKGVHVHDSQTDAAGYYKTGRIWVGNDDTKSAVRYFNAGAAGYWQTESVAVTIKADETARQDFRILRQRRGAIEGTVRDAVTRQPLAGADVGGHTTDANGHYRISDVNLGYRNAPVTYGYYAQKQGYWHQLEYVQVRAGETSTLDFELLRECATARIVGVVLNAATQQPIAGASVHGGGASSTTNAAGRFDLVGIRLGFGNSPYDVWVTASAPGFFSQSKIVTVFCGATISLDFGRAQTKLGTIVGTVTNGATGAALANAFVGSEFGASTRTDANGHYKLEGAPLGDNNADRDWNVIVAPDGFLAQSKAVTVKADTEVRADFQFSPQANRPPVADGKTLVTDEDAALPVKLTGSDPDDDPITFVVVTQPQHGTLSGTPPALTYTPAAHYSGPDSFTYKATDGELESDPATVSITVNETNEGPQCASPAFGATEDEPLASAVSCADSDGDALTYELSSGPVHGTIDFHADGTFTYVPAADYHGADAFHFRAADGSEQSVAVEASITVEPVNDSPSAVDDAAAADQDLELAIAAVSLLANDSDPDGDTLTVVSVLDATHGAVALDGTTVTFTPEAGYAGPAAFRYRISDGHGGDAEATVAVTVRAANAPPVTTDDTASVPEDGSTVIDVLANDSPGTGEAAQHLTATLSAPPAHGLASVTPAGISYAPAPEYNGSDTIGYLACDDGTPSRCASGSVSVDVTPVNDRPEAADGTLAIDEDAPPAAVDLGALTSDAETHAAELTYEIVSAPAKGVLTGDGPVVRYDSNENANGVDGFTYRVVDRGDPDACLPQPRCDAPLASEVRTIHITLAPLHDPPMVTLDPAGPVPEGGSVDLVAHGGDPDGDPITYVWHAAGGTLVPHGDTARLSAADGPAAVAVTVTVDDGAHTAQAEAVVRVVNIAPEVDAGADRETAEGSVVALEAAGFTDAGADDTHTATVDWGDTTAPGEARIVGRSVVADHVYDDNGTYRATVTVLDDDGGSSSDTLAVTVRNVAPTVDAGPDLAGPWGTAIAFVGAVRDVSEADTAAGLHPVWTFGDGSAPVSGAATEHAYAMPGAYTATLTATDKDGGGTSDDAAVRIVRRATTLAVDGPTTMPYGASTLAARLADAHDPTTARLAGREVVFELGDAVYRARAGADGLARVSMPAPLPPGSHALTVHFDGDDLYLPSEAAATLVVGSTRGKVTGGALRTSANGRGGFNVHSNGQTTNGQLQYQSVTAGKLHSASMTGLAVMPDGRSAWFSGVGKDGRTFVVYIEDNGEPGDRDVWRMWIDGRLETDGALAGGNIQVHK